MKSVLKINDAEAAAIARKRLEEEDSEENYDFVEAARIAALILCQNGYHELANEIAALDCNLPGDELRSGICPVLFNYYRKMRFDVSLKLRDARRAELKRIRRIRCNGCAYLVKNERCWVCDGCGVIIEFIPDDKCFANMEW